MIEYISTKITDKIIERNLISGNVREWYIYAFIRIIETTITVCSVLLIGIFLNRFIAAILFLMFFVLLRRRTGGFHCEKYWQCYSFTLVIFFAIFLSEKFLSTNSSLLYVMLALSAALIYYFGTINHPNMDLDSAELTDSQKKSRQVLTVELAIITIISTLNISNAYIVYMSVAIILSAILMMLAKLTKQEI